MGIRGRFADGTLFTFRDGPDRTTFSGTRVGCGIEGRDRGDPARPVAPRSSSPVRCTLLQNTNHYREWRECSHASFRRARSIVRCNRISWYLSNLTRSPAGTGKSLGRGMRGGDRGRHRRRRCSSAPCEARGASGYRAGDGLLTMGPGGWTPWLIYSGDFAPDWNGMTINASPPGALWVGAAEGATSLAHRSPVLLTEAVSPVLFPGHSIGDVSSP